ELLLPVPPALRQQPASGELRLELFVPPAAAGEPLRLWLGDPQLPGAATGRRQRPPPAPPPPPRRHPRPPPGPPPPPPPPPPRRTTARATAPARTTGSWGCCC